MQEKSIIKNNELIIRDNFSDRIEEYKHEVGNEKCSECLDKIEECKCGGLIHTQFIEEFGDCSVITYSACDKCGDDYSENI